MEFSTLCVHPQGERADRTGAVSIPVYQSATFAHPGVGESTGYDYSRLQNPTREHLERTVAALEGGVDAMAFSSGMAAIATMMELFRPGDHILCSDDLYGGSHRLFEHVSSKNGLAFDFLDTSDLERLRGLLRPNTKAIFVETPTNPMMQVTDLAAVAAIARERECLLIVDNTFLTPYFQRPLALGAHIVLHSGTKFLGGHNDTLAGFLITGDPALAERLRFLYKTTGSCLAPWDSWLLLRGIKTLSVRMERQQETALRLARWLEEQSAVEAVHYVGLPAHPGHGVSRKQSTGFGSMISFSVDSPRRAEQVLSRVKLILFAESLGGVESLITYPMLQTHADMARETLQKKGINDRLLRLSVGLEAPEDLIADLEQALSHTKPSREDV